MDQSAEQKYVCLSKFRQGKKVVGYAIQESSGRILQLRSDELRYKMSLGLQVENLKITKDGRIIDKKIETTNTDEDKFWELFKDIDKVYDTDYEVNFKTYINNLEKKVNNLKKDKNTWNNYTKWCNNKLSILKEAMISSRVYDIIVNNKYKVLALILISGKDRYYNFINALANNKNVIILVSDTLPKGAGATIKSCSENDLISLMLKVVPVEDINM